MLIKNVDVAIVHIYFFKFNILIEDKERPAKTKNFPAKLCACAVLDTFGSTRRSITLRSVGLGAVLAIFGFSR